MKKLFTMIAVCAVTFTTYTASAGTPVQAVKGANVQTNAKSTNYVTLNLRAATCDTLLNEGSLDTPNVYLSGSPNEGFFSGNGALDAGGTFYPQIGVGERYTTTVSTPHVTTALVIYGYIVINAAHADSAQKITAYVYDTTGTSPVFNEYEPGAALDSASVTLGSISNDITNGQATVFNFTHQPQLASGAFFITTSLPLTTGDTLAVATNQGTTGDGNAWLEFSAGAAGTGWASFDSLTGGTAIGSYIIVSVCSAATSSCPTITTTASEIGSSTSAYATASGGVGPYTYSWSSSATTDTATGLVNGNTYTVTATDHNGCTGTATVSIATGIASIDAGVANFSVYPNPSNGVFTANVSLVVASDVTISVTDMTGSKIYESSDKAVKDLNKQINLSTIATGIYFVSVKTAQGTANQRIVIK